MGNRTDKVFSLAALLARLSAWRVRGSKIVFTNGCFDLLHLGHVDYLERARELGDRLVVGLNADSSVQGLKGPQRPLRKESERTRLLAALTCVDAVCIFAEATPIKLIAAVKPDLLVKGGDYIPEEIVGYDLVTQRGGQVLSLPLVEGYSTSSLIEKIRKMRT